MIDAELVLAWKTNQGYADCSVTLEEHDNKIRADVIRENEQDAYHRGYIVGQAKCSFDNEMKIRADERTKVLTQFLFELGKNVAYEKVKVFGADVISVDALMTICRELEEQVKEQSNV